MLFCFVSTVLDWKMARGTAAPRLREHLPLVWVTRVRRGARARDDVAANMAVCWVLLWVSLGLSKNL